jgi:hypothetical protein
VPRRVDDPTIGATFDLRVLSNRWGHGDSYGLTRVAKGWKVSFFGVGGSSDKQGRPYLFRNLEHDGIDYPKGLGERLEFLWDEAHERRMSVRQVQQALNSLARWLRIVEHDIPGTRFWSRYKRKHRAFRG